MNLVECKVTNILGSPYFKYGKWWVNVEYLAYGSTFKTGLMFESKEEAEDLKTGYVFDA